MAKLTKKDVLHVAELAKIKITDSEVKKFLPQLSKIVEFVGLLDEVDTKGVEQTSQTTGLKNVLREDKIKPSVINLDDAISATDNVHNGFFKVKAILSERTDK